MSFSNLLARAESAEGAAERGFLEYHEPTVIPLLTLVSFLFFLTLSDWLAGVIVRAGLIGQIVVGLIYGAPIGNILPIEWQETFVALGYLGLILIVFEGGLTVRLDLLKKNFILSVCAACLGILTPIAFCYLLLYLGFDYGPIETFIIGAALSATSLGTTFVVMSPANTGLDFIQTTVGNVLLSAALLDDISALVMVSVVHKLGALSGSQSPNVGWIIGRPIVASFAMAVCTPLFCKYLFGPIFRRYLEPRLVRFKHVPNIVLMTLVLCAFIAISSYAGASVLYGSFLAGAFLSALPSTHPAGPYVVESKEEGEDKDGKMPTFAHSFEEYIAGAQTYILQPLFFASIGFAVPFSALWTGKAIWRGIVTTLLMVVGKAAVGVVIPITDALTRKKGEAAKGGVLKRTWKPATFLGMAMVARGEIGLLIIQVGLNETSYLSQDAFITGAWAIILNTIIGPVCVGLLLRKHKMVVYEDERWGAQEKEMPGLGAEVGGKKGLLGAWADRSIPGKRIGDGNKAGAAQVQTQVPVSEVGSVMER